MTDKEWWKNSVVYQIYPRSFQDSNNDGIGDIPGIISRLDILKDLGIDVIWLSPVYRSPDADNGYDISDYRAIDPKFGTMADMDQLIFQARKRGIKIIMDLVINHTSDEHEWFIKSKNGDPDYRDYYIWKKGKGKNKPPNNWRGFFMDDVWEYDEKSGEYYLHLFAKKQPDLNYRNEKVITEVKDILRFWLDKGIAGFRCDVINVLYKDSFADGKLSTSPIVGLEHYRMSEKTHEILRRLRKEALADYDCFTVGETVMIELPEAQRLLDPQHRELDMLFFFDHLEVDRYVYRYIPKPFRAKKLLEVLTKWQQGLPWNAVYLENHDQPRIVSHYGNDEEYWERSAKMLAILQFTLRGTPFIYQGQEIGMTNFDFTSLKQLQDVESFNIDNFMKKMLIPKSLRWQWIKVSSRDNARTPMQWNDQPNAGFSVSTPWLGLNSNYVRINYENQIKTPDSVLSFYRGLIALRRNNEVLTSGKFIPVYADKRLLIYQRSLNDQNYYVLLNFSNKSIKIKIPLSGEVVLTNVENKEYHGELLPYQGLIIKRGK